MDEREFFQMVADRTQLSRQEAADHVARRIRPVVVIEFCFDAVPVR
ncbi:hypothetical protein [Streptomyces iranensis]